MSRRIGRLHRASSGVGGLFSMPRWHLLHAPRVGAFSGSANIRRAQQPSRKDPVRSGSGRQLSRSPTKKPETPKRPGQAFCPNRPNTDARQSPWGNPCPGPLPSHSSWYDHTAQGRSRQAPFNGELRSSTAATSSEAVRTGRKLHVS